VKTMTSRSQRIVPMLPQQTVQPKNNEACTAAPLQNREHGVNSFDPGDKEEDCFVKPTSFVVTADHNPGRDDGGPLGQRFVGRGGKWLAIAPNRHGVRRCAATQQLQAEAFLAL
jgi:hypothetical protein